MSSWALLQFALFAVAALLVVLSFATFLQRFVRTRAQAARLRREAVVRPRLMHLLTEDEPVMASLDDLGSADLELVEVLVWQLLTKVRGSTRALLVEWLQHRGAIERARAATSSRRVVRRATAAEQLGDAGLVYTSPEMIALLDDHNTEVRIVAARALGKLGDPRAVPALLGAIDGDNGVPTSIVSMSLLHVGSSAIDGLVDGLASPSPVVRGVAAEILGMHGAMNAERRLSSILQQDPEPEVRISATNALGRIGVPRSVEVLTRATSSTEPVALRIAAARALGLVGGAGVVPVLQTLLASADEELGAAAAEALAACGTAGRSALHVVAGDESIAAERARDWVVRLDLDSSARRSRHAVTIGGRR